MAETYENHGMLSRSTLECQKRPWSPKWLLLSLRLVFLCRFWGARVQLDGSQRLWEAFSCTCVGRSVRRSISRISVKRKGMLPTDLWGGRWPQRSEFEALSDHFSAFGLTFSGSECLYFLPESPKMLSEALGMWAIFVLICGLPVRSWAGKPKIIISIFLVRGKSFVEFEAIVLCSAWLLCCGT